MQPTQLQVLMVTALDKQKVMFITVAAQPAQLNQAIGCLLALIKEH